MDYAFGIDIGTGSVKGVAVRLNGNPFAADQQLYSYSSPKPGYHEQDPEQIWEAFQAACKRIVEKTGHQPKSVGLSSAMHSLIPVDEHCRALAPMMTWADSRSFEVAKKLRATKEGRAIYRATGTPLHAMSPLCKLIWLKSHEKRVFNKAAKFISIKEYIWYRLFNEFVVDHSLASGTGLFDIVKLKWHPESLAMAGITADRLSRPEPTFYTRHCKTDELFGTGTPITIGAGDGCLANLGSQADKPGIAAITIGTSGAVRVASNKPLPNTKAMTFSYILDTNTYICGGPVNNGGIAMQWWVKNFSGSSHGSYLYNKIFEEVAQAPPGSDGLLFLPYLTGERAPIWDSESCGNFFDVKLRHTHAHFSRAVMEGICFALKDVLQAVEKNAGSIKQINVSGGFVTSRVWVQALADITNKTLAVVQADDASAVGAAFMALKATGLADDYPVPSGHRQQLFRPVSENAKLYDKQFGIFRQLYTDLKKTMQTVSGLNS